MRNSQMQIETAREELQMLFPWLDWHASEFATLMVDRAEPKQYGGFKPDTSYCKKIHNMIVAWPTKLALAPKLATEILSQLEMMKLTPQLLDTRELRSWPMPPLANPIWEHAFCKNAS